MAGFCTVDRRDELGRLPAPVERDLTPCYERGPNAAIAANLAIGSAVVIAVPDASRLRDFTGIAAIARATRARDLPHTVIDPRTDRDQVISWIGTIPATSGSRRIFVTGPRGTRWPEGERLSWQLIACLGDLAGSRGALA